MIIGYIRVSTIEQDTSHQRNAILEFANSQKIIVDKFIEIKISSKKNTSERKIDQLLNELKKNDLLIVTELSRLGRSILEIINIINEIIEKGIKFISIKENIEIKDSHSIQSKVMITMFGLFAELEHDLISLRTKSALATKKASGIKLGRPKGKGKSKLDKHKEQIEELLKKAVSKASIAKILGVSYPTLFQYVKQLEKSQENNKK